MFQTIAGRFYSAPKQEHQMTTTKENNIDPFCIYNLACWSFLLLSFFHAFIVLFVVELFVLSVLRSFVFCFRLSACVSLFIDVSLFLYFVFLLSFHVRCVFYIYLFHLSFCSPFCFLKGNQYTDI